MLASILACQVFTALVVANSDSVVKTARFDSSRWTKGRSAASHESITLHIALRQADGGQAVERHLSSLSNPNSPKFRQHLSVEEVMALSEPLEGSVKVVEHWLREHGVLGQPSPSHDMYEVEMTISQAESLLNTTYSIFSDGSQEIVRTEAFSLPAYIAEHIDFISPTTSFPKPASPMTSARTSRDQFIVSDWHKRDSCGSGDQVTPTCIREVYNIGNYTAQPNRTTFAVYGTEGATFKPSDLQKWLSEFNPPASQASATYEVIGNGAANESGGIEPQFETALDTQTLLGIAWPATGILYRNGGVFGPNPGQTYDNFVQFLSQLITNDTVPSVVSFSESTPEDNMDPAYARRLCNMMAQVGARGVTLLFSSGDNGPQGDTSSGAHKALFEPEFPASCPWVTAVGGTTDLAAETAATKSTLSLFTQLFYTASGGGFSNLFPQPPYQSAAVPPYIATQIPPSYFSASGFNASGRGIPDVSAFSANFPVVVDGLTIPIGGTSASTPTWAAVIALLNDYEVSRGRPTLGFVNPWLYGLAANASGPAGLKDITTGGNNAGACNFLAGCHLSETPGFNVTVGWDPVTGLGSPVFDELTRALDEHAACRR